MSEIAILDRDSTENDRLDVRRTAALEVLIIERDVPKAATAAGVSVRTVYRWISEDADFRAELRRVEGEQIDRATQQLLGLVDASTQVLQDVLSDGNATNSERLRAAQLVLDNVVKLRELRNIEDRIARLEEIVR